MSKEWIEDDLRSPAVRRQECRIKVIDARGIDAVVREMTTRGVKF